MQALLLESDIAIFTESHACSDVMAGLLHVQGFTVAHHCVRSGRERGRGGVAVYVRAALAAHVVLVGQRQAPGFESVWLRVSHNCLALDGHDLLVGAVYASPGSSSEHRRGGDSHVTEKSAAQAIFGGLLLAAITDFQLPTDTLLLAGDFNARVGTLHGDAALVHNHLDELARLTSGVPPPGPDAPSSIVVPSRSTQDTGAPSAFGRALMALADAADLVVLNGRADGDLHARIPGMCWSRVHKTRPSLMGCMAPPACLVSSLLMMST